MSKVKVRVPQNFFSWQFLNGPISNVIQRLKAVEKEQAEGFDLGNIELNCVVRSEVNIGGVVHPLLEIYLTGEKEMSGSSVKHHLRAMEEREYAEYRRLKAKYEPNEDHKEYLNRGIKNAWMQTNEGLVKVFSTTDEEK